MPFPSTAPPSAPSTTPPTGPNSSKTPPGADAANARNALPLPGGSLDLSTCKGIQAAAGHILSLNLSGRLSEHQARQLSRLLATAERTLDPHESGANPNRDLTAEFAAIFPSILASSEGKMG